LAQSNFLHLKHKDVPVVVSLEFWTPFFSFLLFFLIISIKFRLMYFQCLRSNYPFLLSQITYKHETSSIFHCYVQIYVCTCSQFHGTNK
jgi:hypothetical protein